MTSGAPGSGPSRRADASAAAVERARAVDALRPDALAALDRQIAAVDGSIERLRRLADAADAGLRDPRGVIIGVEKDPGSSGTGDWKDLESGPCRLLAFLRYEGRKIDLVFADDGSTYAIGLGRTQEFAAGRGRVEMPLTALPSALLATACETIRRAVESTQSAATLRAVIDLPEPEPEPAASRSAAGARQRKPGRERRHATATPRTLHGEASGSRRRRWFGRGR